ncbi:MAG TPA: hypothetical protein VIU11_02210 [Nakamurella sp.]
MKRRDLIRTITAAATARDLDFTLHSDRGPHEKWRLDGLTIPVPRHTEIGERLAETIFKECEPKLGPRWWRT